MLPLDPVLAGAYTLASFGCRHRLGEKPIVFQCRRVSAILVMLVLTFCTGCAVLVGRTGPRPRILVGRPAGEAIQQFGSFELAFDLQAAYVCPFDTREIRVMADVMTPSGEEVHVPCFLWQPFGIKLAERGPHLQAVKLLKIYVPRATWPEDRPLRLLIDDVSLTDSLSGDRHVLWPSEAGSRWHGVGAVAEAVDVAGAPSGRPLCVHIPAAESGWPGAQVALDAADWSRFDALSFSVCPQGDSDRGSIAVELYTTDGRKLDKGFPFASGQFQMNRWSTLVWRWPRGETFKGFEPSGPVQWRFRFCPSEVGTYRYRLSVVDLCGRAATEWRQFECRPSAENAAGTGPIRVAPDRRHFQFDSGEPYFAIGHNVCWPGKHRGILDYDRYFEKMAANGENYTRIWMCPWAFGVQWGETARDLRLDQAWALDYVFDLADQHGIKVMLCLDYHGALREKKGSLGKNPYLSRNGGPCAEPRDFFTSAQARQLYRDRLRYLVARYSHRISLLAWEFWNEVDLVDGYDERRVAKWHRDMAKYLRKTDPYDHLITTSCASPKRGKRMWRLKQIGYTQTHSYNLDDKAADVLRWSRDKAQYHKPHFVGEFGFSGGLHGRGQDDEQGLHLHNGIWASALSGDAGTAMLWWWDHYIDPHGLYRHFKALSRFLEGVPWIEAELRPETLEVDYAEGTAAGPIDVSLEPGAASWKRAVFNRPNHFVVSRFGEIENQAALSRVLHGFGNHPKLHNPATFEIDCQRAGRFVVKVLGVSGHGGANLNISVDGKEELFVDFLDPDGKTETETLRQYDREYGVALARGAHEVVVGNTGQDWAYVAYRLEGLCVSHKPDLRIVCLRGRGLVLLWLQNRGNAWPAVMEGEAPLAVSGGVVRIRDMEAGAYEVEWWDTWRGAVADRRRAVVGGEGSSLILALPPVPADVACKIRLVR